MPALVLAKEVGVGIGLAAAPVTRGGRFLLVLLTLPPVGTQRSSPAREPTLGEEREVIVTRRRSLDHRTRDQERVSGRRQPGEHADARAVTLEVASQSLLTLRLVSTPDKGGYEALSRLGELGREIERRRGPDPYPRPTGPAPSLDVLRRRRDDIMRIAARHGARTVSVFGSVARGDAGPHSDVDLLVDTGDPQSLFEQAALQNELEDLLGCPVHVLTTGGIELCP